MIAILSLAISLGYIVGGSSFQQNLVLDGVSLPVDWSSSVNYFPALTAESALVTAQFLGNNTATISSIVGKKKTDPQTKKIFAGLHKTYVDFTIEPNLPDGYLYFGNGDDLKNLPYMLKTNAFFMAAVRSGPNKTFEIDPFGYRGSTYFSQLTACLKNTVPRVSATLDPLLNVLKLKVFNSSDPTTELTGYSQEQAATYLLYQISYFAQNVHASTHVSYEPRLIFCYRSLQCEILNLIFEELLAIHHNNLRLQFLITYNTDLPSDNVLGYDARDHEHLP